MFSRRSDKQRSCEGGPVIRLPTAFALALLAAIGLALAQGAGVERIQLIRAGIWREAAGGTLELEQATHVIRARIGTLFGSEWRAFGRPQGASVTLKVRWQYPEPGMIHPVTRALRTSDEFDYDVAIGARTVTYLELHSDYMLLPGKWALEVQDGDHTLLRQEFTLVR